MNDPTLSRPMFKQTPSATTPMMPTTGIGGMTTPDQNAQALRNMFSPQAFKRGGEVINGVAHFADGDEVVAPPPQEQGNSVIPARRYGTVSSGQRYGFFSTNKSPEEEAAAAYDRDVKDQSVLRTPSPFAPGSPAERSYLNRQAAAARLAEPNSRVATQRGVESSDEGAAALELMKRGRETGDAKLVQEGAAALERLSGRAYSEAGIPEPANEPLRKPGETPPVTGGIGSLSPEAMASMEDKDRLDVMRPGGMFSIGAPSAPAPAAPAVPPPNKKDEPISTNLETIKARREASDKQRDENKWMGLLAAGLGMMASKSRTAAGGIGEGGLQGLQTFAGLEKARREDEANLRREDYQQQQLALQNKQFALSEQQLAQQKQIAMAQLEKDPDTVRLYRALGGGDLMKGYQLASSDATLKSAQLIAADPMADEASKAQARAYLNSRIAEASGARAGGGQLPPVRLISK